MSEEEEVIVNKILGSNPSQLIWQLDDSKGYVELFNSEDEDLDAYYICMDSGLFEKDIDYVKSWIYQDGYEQNWDSKKVKITDEDIEFELSEIIDIFFHHLDDKHKKNNINLIKI